MSVKEKGQKEDSKDVCKIEKENADKEKMKAGVKSDNEYVNKATEDTESIKINQQFKQKQRIK